MQATAAPPPARGAGSLPSPTQAPGTVNQEMPFDHIVVVMMENHSFDNLLGALPLTNTGADGLTFDPNGQATNSNPGPAGTVTSHALENTAQASYVTQSWTATHAQINGGAMDGFVKSAAENDPAGAEEPMGYYTPQVLPFAYGLASSFTVANRWFCSVPGPTYPNRRFLLAGTAWGLTATSVTALLEHPAPPNGTIFDLLSHHHVSWADYFTDVPMSLLVPTATVKHLDHHHLIDKFFEDCAAGTLPAVSFVDPGQGVLFRIAQAVASLPTIKEILKLFGVDVDALPPAETEEDPVDMYYGEAWAHQVIEAVLQSPAWDRTLLIYTYDEHGGYYDHVPPPRAIPPDSFAPAYPAPDPPGAYDMYGPRVPTIVASPYSIPGGVTNLVHDHTSILATIEAKWNLPALTNRDANANTIMDFLNPAEAALQTPPVIPGPLSSGPSGPVTNR